jgi:hypothetical protein
VEKVNAKTGIVKDGYSVILYLFNEDYHLKFVIVIVLDSNDVVTQIIVVLYVTSIFE